MFADQQMMALTFSLGGLAVAVVAAGAGLRLLRTKALFEYKLATVGKDLPYAASLYFTMGARVLHFGAGGFGLLHLADLALARVMWSGGTAATLGYLAAALIGLSGMALVSLATIDFKVKISPLGTRLFQFTAGLCGVAVAVLGVITLAQWGYFWPPT